MGDRFYKHAASILRALKRGEGNIKSLCFSEKVESKKKMYAVISEVVRYENILKQVLEKSEILKHEKRLDEHLCMILVYDFLFGQGVQTRGKLKDCIMKHKTRLKAELVKAKIKVGVVKNEDLSKEIVPLPRYVRVNTLLTDFETVRNHFQETALTDVHIPDLLVFPPKFDLHKDPMYINGSIIIQDKASCFPAFILNPEPGSHVIDCCAAPGNKTSHLAAIMHNSGRIFAFDKSSQRLETLKKLTTKAGCKIIEPINGDFLLTDPLDPKYEKVEYILCDPSCSGSGMPDQVELAQPRDLKERLGNLSRFQFDIVSHAMSFPKVKLITYSTCSIYDEENEMVVSQLLKSNPDWRLRSIIPEWKHRGKQEFADSQFMIRCDQTDNTTGFFVVCFGREIKGQ